MTTVDLRPAARRMAELIKDVPDGALAADALPRVQPRRPRRTRGRAGDRLRTAAAKDVDGGATGQQGSGDASRLPDDWRTRIPPDLEAMAEAWRDPEAWTGMTQAGGIDLPGEAAGIVTLDELVTHAWDVARSSGPPYDCDEPTLQAVLGFVSQSSGPGQEASRAASSAPWCLSPTTDRSSTG